MNFPDLRSFLAALESEGELFKVRAELSPRLEAAAAITLVAHRTGQAVLLEKVKGYESPIVGNLLGSYRRLAILLGVPEKDLAKTYLERRSHPIKPRLVSQAPVQEVEIKDGIDILKTMPVLTHHQGDAGPYFSCAFVVAKDPETGTRGLGIHRIQVKDKNTLGIFLASPPLSEYLARAEKLNKPLEIAIVSGADPITYFSSPQHAPPGVDKYDIAGGLAQSPVELVKCKSVDLEVPANAEFVLDGFVIPHQRDQEGPFGESTGYYLTYNNPVAKIQLISHRRKPLYHALVPFATEEQTLQFPTFQTESLVWLKKALPSVSNIHSPALGVVYVQIEKHSDGDPQKVIEILFSRVAGLYAKVIVVVDSDVDIFNADEMAWALGSRVQPDRDIIIKSDLPGLIIDPSTTGQEEIGEHSMRQTKTAKVGIDATKPLAELKKYEKVDMPADIKQKVSQLLGFAEG
jgi:2,5-furandicarboxylate decarboxylase 1